jgi:hypothetical protein
MEEEVSISQENEQKSSTSSTASTSPNATVAPLQKTL